MVFGELEGHHVLRRAHHQLLLQLDLVLTLAVRPDQPGREVHQGERLLGFALAHQLIAHTELGAQARRHHRGRLDRLVGTAENALARLRVLDRCAGEYAVFDRPLDTHIGHGQVGGQAQGQDRQTEQFHLALLEESWREAMTPELQADDSQSRSCAWRLRGNTARKLSRATPRATFSGSASRNGTKACIVSPSPSNLPTTSEPSMKRAG